MVGSGKSASLDWGSGGPPLLLRFNKSLYEKYENKLTGLSLKYPYVSYSIAEPTLSANLETVIESIGFISSPPPAQNPKSIATSVSAWLKRNRLVLLHYQPKSTNITLVDLLKGIKKLAPNTSFESLIPIFIGEVSSSKQRDVFRVLGAFGIRYAIFLSGHVNAAERNIEELLEGLYKFSKLAKTNFKNAQRPDDDLKTLNTEKIRQYKEQMAAGDALMQRGNYEDAIKFFTKAVEVKPDFDILLKRGDAYYRNEEFIPALADYREANKMEQEKADPYAKISSCCFALAKEEVKKGGKEKAKQWMSAGMKNLGTAVKVTEKIEKGNKGMPEKMSRTPYAAIVASISDSDIRGMGLEQEEVQLAKITSLVMEKTKDTDYMDSKIDIEERINKAMLLARIKKYEEAEKIFRQIVAEDTQNIGPAFNNFAVELRKNGQYGKAYEIYLELLKYKVPDRDIVVQNLKTAGMRWATLLKEKNKNDQANAVYKKIREYNPTAKI